MAEAARQSVLTEDDDDEPVEVPGGQAPPAQTLRPLETPAIQTDRGGEPTGDVEYEIFEGEDPPPAADTTSRERPDGASGQPAGETFQQRRERETREAQALGISRSSLRRKRARDSKNELLSEVETLRAQLGERDAEFKQLRERVERFEPRFTEMDAERRRTSIAQVDSALTTAQRTLTDAESRQRQAMMDNDVDAFMKAQTEGREAYLNVERLKYQKRQIETTPAKADAAPAAAREPGATAPAAPARTDGRGTDGAGETRTPQLDPVAKAYTEDFVEDNRWFDPNPGTTDPDSRIVFAIDNLIYQRGFRPNTEEYWEELERRLRTELPHRFAGNGEPGDGDRRPAAPPARPANGQTRPNVPTQRRGPMTAGAGDRPPARNGRVQVHVNADRKQALIAGGYVLADGSVPDRKRLDRVLAGYAEQDRQAAGR